MSGAPPARQLPWIQVGRGVAAVLVVLTHASLLAERNWDESFLGGRVALGADVGVAFFFVLSGFIIVYIHARDISQPDRARSYATKRFTRIYPLYWVISVALLPAYFLLPEYWADDEKGLAYLVKSFLLLPQESLPLLSVGWTLTHEVLFYVVFGLVVWLPRAAWIPIVGVLVGGTLVKFVADWGAPRGGDRYFTSVTPLDNWELTSFLFSRFNLLFLAGCLVGLIVLRTRYRPPVALGVLGAAMLLVPMLWPESSAGIMAFWTGTGNGLVLYWSVWAGLVVWVSATRPGAPAPRAGLALGDASYSLYLVHYPVLIVASLALSRILPDSLSTGLVAQAVFAALVAIGVLAGLACYRWLEQPLLARTRRSLAARSS
ncbi:MAG: acyltransferase [Actinomycetota bacterium]|nr:acyltransferase [Actinomycetota bacterium]